MASRGPKGERGRALDTDTRESPGVEAAPGAGERLPMLTVLSHPDPARTGERAELRGLSGGIALSRTGPDFAAPESGEGEAWPLADPFLSRRPVMISGDPAAVRLERAPDSVALTVDGQPLEGARVLGEEALARGVVLELGGRVCLCLHHGVRVAAGEDLGLVGYSGAIAELRQAILRVADLPVSVLLRGPTGSGKELVAQAIHQASSRADRPCLSVNMAALSPAIATSELFGHAKGAFTGAVEEHPGFFVRAHGGTLFLDEIGEAPVEVQVALLRVLETSQVQPVGGRAVEAVDVRLISATDAELEAAVAEGRFRAALLHRLAGFEIQVPPLSARVEDLGRLFLHFAREELARIQEVDRLSPKDPPAAPWMPPALMARLARYAWPGNVRQLRNVARQLVIAGRGRPELTLDPALERLLAEPDSKAPSAPGEVVREAGAPRRKPSEVTEEELAAALKKHKWKVDPTAQSLRLSRASLYMLIEKSKKLRKAKDVPEAELLAAFDSTQGDVDRMSELLEVSGRGLYLRLKELGRI